MYGGLKFFDRKEIKDIVCYLRVLDNPLDDVALRRIINVPKRGIGEVSYNNAYDIALREDTNVLNVFLNAGNYPELSEPHQACKLCAKDNGHYDEKGYNGHFRVCKVCDIRVGHD